MNSFALLVLFAWPLLALLPFARFEAHRASALVVVLGWLFLPNVSINLPGLPDYTKWTAMALGLLAGTVAFRPDRLSALRLGIADVPMLLWILSAVGASLTNGYGVYDGLAGAFNRALTWGVPWVAGRIHFVSRREREELLVVLVGAALAYTPLVLWEVRMSPQLHRTFYGFAQHSFAQTYRGGGWRPMVFTDHGLALSLFMGSSAVAALALHRVRAKVMGVPVLVAFAALTATTILCKSLGAIALTAAGIGLLLLPVPFLVWPVLLALPILYVLVRLLHPTLLDSALGLFGWVPEDRIDSLAYRWRCEDLLAGIGWRKPWFGVTTRGYATYDEYGQVTRVVTDSLWIISFVGFGITGLAGSMGTFLLGAARGLLARARTSLAGMHRAETGIGIVLLLVSLDSLANAFATPVWLLMAGAIGSFQPHGAESHAAATKHSVPVAAPMAPPDRLVRREERVVGQTGHPGGRLRRRPLKPRNPRERSQ